jgi:hypothetical protein
MRKELRRTGRTKEALLSEMRAMKAGNIDWQRGRAPLFAFKATDDLYETNHAAFFKFFTENALGGRRAFPSVKRMEDEVVAMALGLFSAPDGAQGFMTTGGTFRPRRISAPSLRTRATSRPALRDETAPAGPISARVANETVRDVRSHSLFPWHGRRH